MEQEVDISMDTLAIIKTCEGKGLKEVPKCSLVNDCSVPDPPSERLTKDQLSPLIQCCGIGSKEDAFHPNLEKICLKHPIVMIRDLTKVLELNLNLFSTETLVEINPNLSIETREQMKYASHENWDKTQNEKVWQCISQSSRSTMCKYAKYQAKHLENQNSQEDTRGNVLTSKSSPSNPGPSTSDQVQVTKNEIVKFATNVDLSTTQCQPQLKELAKLPPFLKVECETNMLSYLDCKLLGINTVQLYMKVPGCKTVGHQENNNFCSVNINIGPGDNEWFAVPYEYWGVIHSLCEQNDIDYMCDSWWPPDVDVLRKKNIPVYRFCQKPGDIVWVNVGCVHWVQAIGCCNNIAWNVGPFTVKQYQLAIERYEWNKLHQYRSIVPMVYLSWMLAHYAAKKKMSNPLFWMIKNCLLQSLKQNIWIMEYLKHRDVNVKCDRDRRMDQYPIYCNGCNVWFSTFNKSCNILYYIICI